MELKFAEKNFLDLSQPHSDISNAQFVVASVPVEGTVSYGGGTHNGPSAIIEASRQVELFDEEGLDEPYMAGIATLEIPQPFFKAEDGVASAREQVREIVKRGKIPIVLGGEHSLSCGALQALSEHYDEFSLLHFDAHGDLRDSYHGNPYSHASALRRCLDVASVKHLVQVGIRNVSNVPEDGNEYDFLKAHTERVTVFWAREMASWRIEDMIKPLSKNVYITFDVDALDPSIMPATGTPEPGGLLWYQTLDILRAVCTQKNIIGMDFVEFAPIPGFHAPDFLLAKLIYKAIGYITRSSK
ncbi:MAG: agmatinase [bacterium]|nr:agmatinase [bacterium]